MVSIVASIVISKFLHCTILVILSGKRFFQQNFNLKMTMILDAVQGCSFFTVEKDLVARA